MAVIYETSWVVKEFTYTFKMKDDFRVNDEMPVETRKVIELTETVGGFWKKSSNVFSENKPEFFKSELDKVKHLYLMPEKDYNEAMAIIEAFDEKTQVN